MAGVSVADRIFDLQYLKTVLTPDGHATVLDRGLLPDPRDRVIARQGELAFSVRLAHPVRGDADLPDDVGLALRKAAKRMYHLDADGNEGPDPSGVVETVHGPAVHAEVVTLTLDTDGAGAGAPLVAAMVTVLVEELAPLGIQADISVPTDVPPSTTTGWMSKAERGARPQRRTQKFRQSTHSRVLLSDKISGLPRDESGTGWNLDPAFEVLANDRPAALEALQAAGARLGNAEDGGDAVRAPRTPESETRNRVSEVDTSRQTLALTVDTNGHLSEQQWHRMLVILCEELDKRQVEAVLTAWPREQFARANVPVERSAEARWVVVRPVLATTTEGKPYYDCQWWSVDDEWTMNPKAAQEWDSSPNDLVAQLRSVPATEEVGEASGVHLTPGRDPWSMPAKRKRASRGSRSWPG